jgi:hypothetical protein
MIEECDKAWEQLLHKIEHMDDAAWHRTGRFMMNGEDPMMLSVSHKKMA